MTSALIKYSAVTTKARAMYGKCLPPSDWEKLAACNTLRGVYDLTARCPAWTAVGEDPRCAADAALFAAALDGQLHRDCKALCLYLSKADRETLTRYLKGPFDGGMTPEEVRSWWRDGGVKNAGLRRAAGAEADALNLVYVLRLRRFPGSAQEADALLIPIRDRLTPELVRRLLSAKDDRAVLDILSRTPWSAAFTSLEPGALERQYETYMADFCRRVLQSARPGLTVAQAFLLLKDKERGRLVRASGAAARGFEARLVL